MLAEGTFDVEMTPEPPYSVVDAVSLARATVDKRFEGPLTATSQVHMLAARTAVPDSAGFVAMERVTGSLDGKRGSFVLQHSSTMSGGQQQQNISVVPHSGTGELTSLRGTMTIRIEGGVHHYSFTYEFAAGDLGDAPQPV